MSYGGEKSRGKSKVQKVFKEIGMKKTEQLTFNINTDGQVKKLLTIIHTSFLDYFLNYLQTLRILPK